MHIIKEMRTYCWKKDRNDLPLPEPVKIDDHAMDAIRYGIVTHCLHGIGPVAYTLKHSVYPE